jgi:DNA-binding transcriptional LysR family regulator
MRDDRFDCRVRPHSAARQRRPCCRSKLGTSSATVSRRINRLEDQLKVRLLARTTRRVALKEIGRTYLERCERVLAVLDEAGLSIAEEKESRPSGRLRVTAPDAFGRRRLAPVFACFVQAHREVTLEVSLTDERIDIVSQDIDVAIRMASVEGSSPLVARKRRAPIQQKGLPLAT